MGRGHGQNVLAQLRQAEADGGLEEDQRERFGKRADELAEELTGDYYGIVTLQGVDPEDADWLLNAMEAVAEDAGSLASSGVDQPDGWHVHGPLDEQPLDRDHVRRVLRVLHEDGKRPRPRGIADRLGVDLDGDADD